MKTEPIIIINATTIIYYWPQFKYQSFLRIDVITVVLNLIFEPTLNYTCLEAVAMLYSLLSCQCQLVHDLSFSTPVEVTFFTKGEKPFRITKKRLIKLPPKIKFPSWNLCSSKISSVNVSEIEKISCQKSGG